MRFSVPAITLSAGALVASSNLVAASPAGDLAQAFQPLHARQAVSSSSASSSSAASSAVASSTATATASSPATTSSIPQLASNETDIVSNANCQRQNYTVTSTANRTVFNLTALGVRPQTNQSRITALNVEFATQAENFTQKYITGHNVTNQTFQISGIYCEPKSANGSSDKPLLTFIHGIGFDNSYWNFYKNGTDVTEQDYSFAYAAAEAGYSTFRYDRLGTGQSERPDDGYNVAQAPTEAGILTNILEQARNTTNIGGKQWNRTVIIGHSYGSVQSQAVSAARPDLVDGVVLTGFSNYGEGVPFYLLSTVYTQGALVQPDRWANLSQDWLITATNFSNQQNFANPAFVTEDANALARSTEQPVTQGSLFTIGSIGGVSNFTGPVLVGTGLLDFIFLFNRPNGTAIVENTAKTLYPQSRNATGYAPPDLAHGIAFHQQASTFNRYVLQYLGENGL